MFKDIKKNLKKKLEMVSSIISQEKKETIKMLDVYIKHAKGHSSKKEVEHANQQFKDILKTAGLGILAILPLAPITFPLIIYLGKKLNVEILPKSFQKAFEKEKLDEKK
jgi:hypothetical protein